MERKKGWLTSGAFAALCGATKETLRHYKDVGLLLPAYQGDNGYFYYDVEQFYDFYAISIFRQTGTPLEEIRRCLRGQDTAKTLALLREQRTRLEAERQKLEPCAIWSLDQDRTWFPEPAGFKESTCWLSRRESWRAS